MQTEDINERIYLEVSEVSAHRPIILLVVSPDDPRVMKTDLLADLFVERTGGTGQADGDLGHRLRRIQLPVMTGGEGDSTATVPGPDNPPGSLQLVQ